MERAYRLDILSPEKVLFSGNVEYAAFPGEDGAFVVLINHAPLVSSLVRGIVKWRFGGVEESACIKGGFVDVNNNVVTACVEI